jgi:hypothetical protein
MTKKDELEDNYRNEQTNTENNKAEESTERSHATTSDRIHKLKQGALPDTISKEVFLELADYRSNCCMSIYLSPDQPAHILNKPPQTVHFHRVLEELNRKLAEKKIPSHQTELMLAPAFELLKDTEFWIRPWKGLAVFIADDYFKYMRLPTDIPSELFYCEHRFNLTHLIPLLSWKDYIWNYR